MHGHLSLGKLCSVSTPATFTSVLTTGGGWCGGLVASVRVRATVQDTLLGQVVFCVNFYVTSMLTTGANSTGCIAWSSWPYSVSKF